MTFARRKHTSYIEQSLINITINPPLTNDVAIEYIGDMKTTALVGTTLKLLNIEIYLEISQFALIGTNNSSTIEAGQNYNSVVSGK